MVRINKVFDRRKRWKMAINTRENNSAIKLPGGRNARDFETARPLCTAQQMSRFPGLFTMSRISFYLDLLLCALHISRFVPNPIIERLGQKVNTSRWIRQAARRVEFRDFEWLFIRVHTRFEDDYLLTASINSSLNENAIWMRPLHVLHNKIFFHVVPRNLRGVVLSGS